MENTIQRSHVLRTVAIDAVLLTLALLLPVGFHAVGVNLRFLEPMRLVLLAAILFVPERKNAYIIAFILPWLSFVIIGVPMWWKAGMMSVELIINVYLIYRFTDEKLNAGFSVLISILLAKTFYYVVKYIFIQTTILPQMPLIENIPVIVISAIILSAMFHVICIIKKQ